MAPYNAMTRALAIGKMVAGPRQMERAMADRIDIKRVYETPSPEDGTRVLVDRLWPRGLAKSEARIDFWLKEAGPSTALRKWYGHAPERFAEFRRRYEAELDAGPDAIATLLRLAEEGHITLVFAAREAALSNAAVLKEYLARRLKV